jgi:outer membrane protein OmpA-like peptidoglycan-associated protein
MRRVAILLIFIGLAACEAPKPGAVRQFVVFFRTNEAALSPEAKLVVDQIAQTARDRHPAKIAIEGRADGTTPRDQELADKRAAAVSKALTEGGIDANLIEQHASTVTNETGVAAHQVVVRFGP